jgi:hypothetical protein
MQLISVRGTILLSILLVTNPAGASEESLTELASASELHSIQMTVPKSIS